MVLPICFSCVHHGHLLGSTSVWHAARVSTTLQAPSVRDHKVEVRVVVDVARDIVVVLDELFKGHNPVSSSLTAIREKTVVLLEGLNEI